MPKEVKVDGQTYLPGNEGRSKPSDSSGSILKLQSALYCIYGNKPKHSFPCGRARRAQLWRCALSSPARARACTPHSNPPRLWPRHDERAQPRYDCRSRRLSERFVDNMQRMMASGATACADISASTLRNKNSDSERNRRSGTEFSVVEISCRFSLVDVVATRHESVFLSVCRMKYVNWPVLL